MWDSPNSTSTLVGSDKVIMGGRHKNFEDLRLEGQVNRVRKISIQMYFLKHPVLG